MTNIVICSVSCVHDSTELSQIICQKCQREVVKFARVLEQGKQLDKFREKYNEAIKNQLAEYQLNDRSAARRILRRSTGRKKNPLFRIRLRLSEERQEPIKWSLHLSYKPLESTLSRVDL